MIIDAAINYYYDQHPDNADEHDLTYFQWIFSNDLTRFIKKGYNVLLTFLYRHDPVAILEAVRLNHKCHIEMIRSNEYFLFLIISENIRFFNTELFSNGSWTYTIYHILCLNKRACIMQSLLSIPGISFRTVDNDGRKAYNMKSKFPLNGEMELLD